MINLLPADKKQDILYARRNTRLRKWALELLAISVVLIIITGLGVLVLAKSTSDFNGRTAQGHKTLEQQNEAQVKKEVEEISGNLKLVIQVLSKQVLFSKLLDQIGSVMPSGAVLTTLSINKAEGGIDMQAAARNYNTASQVQVNLADPENKIFQKADIVSIQCKSQTAAATSSFDAQYPCVVQIRALFAQNNPFLFINKAGRP